MNFQQTWLYWLAGVVLLVVAVMSWRDKSNPRRLTTGLFCLPLEEGRQLVESLDGVEALWCTTDGEVVTSSGWSEHTN